MLLWSLPAVVAVMLALLAPGLIWAWRCYPSPDGGVRLAVGFALGLAFQIHICALLAAGPGITALSVAAATGAALVVAAILAWKLPARRHKEGQGRRRAIELAALVAAVAVPRLAPLAMQQMPQGWDPSFHSLLASVVLASHQLPSWSPYERIPLNYPYGPHVFIAEISLLTGVAPDRVFAVLLAAVAPAITCLALYGLARRALKSHGAALAAVAAYGLLGNFGSIEYYAWGGLPNALGCFMLLAFLGVLFAPGHERTRMLVGGLILGAIPLVHHHVMLTTILLLCAFGMLLAVRWLMALRSSAPRRRQTAQALRQLAMMSGVALASASYYLLPLALRASSLGATRATQYADHDPGNILDLNGRLLWLLGVIGISMLIAARSVASRMPPKFRPRYALGGRMGGAQLFAACALPTLLAAFALGYYGYRAYSARYLPAHEPFTLFTPTRFLTDATYFLAVFAALPLASAWRWSPTWLVARVARIGAYPGLARAAGRVAVRVAIALGIAATTLSLLDLPALATAGHLAPGEADAFAWIRSHSPSDALVLNLNANSAWAPYFTQREVAFTPVPVSEETAGYVDEKRALAVELLASMAHSQAQVMAFSGTGVASSVLAQRPVILLTDTPLAGTSSPPDFVAGNERVYLLGIAFQGLTSAAKAGGMRVEWWSGGTPAPPAGWTQPGSEAVGWSPLAPHNPPVGGDSYLRIHLNGALPAEMRLVCGASGPVEMWLDGGQHMLAPCGGSQSTTPLRLGAGEHVLAIHSTRPADPADPWLNVLVLGQTAA